MQQLKYQPIKTILMQTAICQYNEITVIAKCQIVQVVSSSASSFCQTYIPVGKG